MMAYTLSSMISVVIDTNVFVAGLRSDGGASRAVLRDALQRINGVRHHIPLSCL
jgi:uncharacterized PurR-regulated membrane protein YhhQ (DUF165 family)